MGVDLVVVDFVGVDLVGVNRIMVSGQPSINFVCTQHLFSHVTKSDFEKGDLA